MTYVEVEIRLKGQLGSNWSDWLGGFTVDPTQEGETFVRGKVRDQSALLGLLNKLTGLGLEVMSFDSRASGTTQNRGGSDHVTAQL